MCKVSFDVILIRINTLFVLREFVDFIGQLIGRCVKYFIPMYF